MFQAEDGIRDLVRSRGLGDVYKRQIIDLSELKKGDVIVLDNKIHDEHVVRVYNKVLFYGHPGISNNHKAIKITKSLLNNNSF